jgi:2-polyprenyl-3-methyl-5-hydroxy-6-metoxy-1,4-benzoquinol methylase/uncharacterized protein YbaR (Trm112 family)
MHESLRQILVCPKCKGDLTFLELDGSDDGEVRCESCSISYPVKNGIPRFVPADNYAGSFGYQWNRFRREQLDRFNKTTLSADRFWSETGWTPDEMRGALILDVGCGAGRFLDVASTTDATVVGMDLSSAIDAAKENLSDRVNVHFVQASIYELPFRDGAFDLCYCIGVIQHTPDPEKSLASIARMVKPTGRLAVTIYPRKPWTKLYSKYWLRPLAKRIDKKRLLKIIEGAMVFAFPLTDVLFRIPVLGKFFMFTVPVANYVHEPQLSREQRYTWAILDTFDMLSPYYDQPMTEEEASVALEGGGVCEVTRLPGQGLNLVATRGPVE